MRRYTICYHEYIGYDCYVVNFRRIRCTSENLNRYLKGDAHFIIDGWPDIRHTDGTSAVETPQADAEKE